MDAIIIAPNTGYEMKAECDGIKYEFRIISYSNVGGYAPILVIDKTHDERYYSNGYLEINGHAITSKWNIEYDANRGNWICSRDILISIT